MMTHSTYRRCFGIAIALSILLLLSACGSATSTSGTQTTSMKVMYELHMQFFSHEAHLSTVIDPQMFVSAPTTPAGLGPQNIKHVAGVKPVPAQDSPSTPLLNADGTSLGVTLGTWKSATGGATLSCRNGTETITSSFQHLLPNAAYSLFIVHLHVNGPKRFTPLGAANGSNNNFTSNAQGEGTKTSILSLCLNSSNAVVLIWHSDGHTHGASPGVLGVTWHNQLIFPVS
ncbi:MAG: hypothetical protein NVS4B11_14760 [Ktedonobacteraceae bacterium]